jgi:hypothetical protein
MKSARVFENAAGWFDFDVWIDTPARVRQKKRADLGSALIDLDADG